MTAVDRPDNGQDEGRDLAARLAGLDLPVPLYPLSRRCCGVPDSTACHQRGLCWMEGVHPESPGFTTSRAGAGEQQRERLADVVADHQPERLRPDGPVDHCSCGWSVLGDFWSLHVADELLALLTGGRDGSQTDRPATCSDRHTDGDLTMFCEQIPGHVGPHVNHRTYW